MGDTHAQVPVQGRGASAELEKRSVGGAAGRGAPRVDAVVVGAGAAGLAAAGRLAAGGLDVALLEAAPAPGGRLAAVHRDGFRLDRAPLLLSGVPEQRLRELIGDGSPGAPPLLRPLRPGVLVGGGGRPRRTGGHRGVRAALASGARTSGASAALEEARLGAALGRLAELPMQRLLARPETDAATALSARGALRTWPAVRPLLSALLSDPDLATSSRYADLVLRGFARDGLALPLGGGPELVRRLAAGLPAGVLRTGVEVVSVAADGVRTARHGTLRARAVVVATDAAAAGRLLPGLRRPRFHPVRTLYHAVPGRSPLGAADAGSLLLDGGGRGPVSHTLVVSDTDPGCAPEGAALVATVLLGEAGRSAPEAAVRGRLGELYGAASAGWAYLGGSYAGSAVPVAAVPYGRGRPVRLLAGLYVCGDHRDVPTVAGAVASGRRAAGSVLADLAVGAVPRGGGHGFAATGAT